MDQQRSNSQEAKKRVHIQMKCDKKTLRRIMDQMCQLNLLSVVDPDCPPDEIQTEYLLWSVWDISTHQKSRTKDVESSTDLDLSQIVQLPKCTEDQKQCVKQPPLQEVEKEARHCNQEEGHVSNCQFEHVKTF